MKEDGMTASAIRNAHTVTGRAPYQTGFADRTQQLPVHTKDIDGVNAILGQVWQK